MTASAAAVARMVIPNNGYCYFDLIALVDLIDVPSLGILSLILTVLDRLALQNCFLSLFLICSLQHFSFRSKPHEILLGSLSNSSSLRFGKNCVTRFHVSSHNGECVTPSLLWKTRICLFVQSRNNFSNYNRKNLFSFFFTENLKEKKVGEKRKILTECITNSIFFKLSRIASCSISDPIRINFSI